LKISLRRKGKKLSEETKEKLSLMFSGSKNPFFNKKHPKEFKEKLSSRRKGGGNPMHGKEF
jgi:NUMOD3 motif